MFRSQEALHIELEGDSADDGELEVITSRASRRWVLNTIVAMGACGAGVVCTVLSAPLWHSPSTTVVTPRVLDDEPHMTCAGSDLENCPWDYKSFHIGKWPQAGYPLCEGSRTNAAPNNQWQSPVDLPDSRHLSKTTDQLQLVALGGGCKKVEMENNPHTFEAAFVHEHCFNLTATWKGAKYTMAQFHFHSESENKVNRDHMPGEMHMVHVAEDGSVLVVGLFLKPGMPGNPFLTRMFSEGFDPTHAVDSEEPVNPYTLVAPGATFYSYLGSFTTPPCTPNVEWVSFIDPVVIEPQALATFKTFLKTQWQPDSYGDDFRPVQPLNKRIVKLGTVAR